MEPLDKAGIEDEITIYNSRNLMEPLDKEVKKRKVKSTIVEI